MSKSTDSEFRVNVRKIAADVKARAEAARALRSAEPEKDWSGDPAMAKQYPLVHSILLSSLLDPECDPGATFFLMPTSDGWLGILTLRWLELKCFRTADTLEGVWQALESFLAEPEPNWRSEDGKRRQKPRKPKHQGKPR